VAESRQPLIESTVISDPGIFTLDAVFDSVTMRTCLREVFPDQWWPIQDIQFKILKHHRGKRCTFEFALRTAKAWSYMIGKVYAADRSDVYRAMDAISRAGFGPHDEFSIPQPLAYVPALRLLLQERVQGPRAKQIFLTGSERDRAMASERCAQWLATFHATAPRSGCLFDLTHQMDSIERWSKTIAKLGEPLASQVSQLSERVQRDAPSTNGRELCAGHGSYNCNQIILTEDRTVTFDWDGYDVADRCRDLARFLVALQRLALKYLGSFRGLDAVADVFLKTYQSLTPFEVGPDLSWYRALTCLRLAKYEASRPVCTFRDGIEALLGEGFRVLEH